MVTLPSGEPEIAPERIRATLASYRQLFGKADLDSWLALFVEDAWVEDPIGTPPHRGLDALRAFFEGTHAMLDSIELRPGLTKVCGLEAITTVEMRPVIGGVVHSFLVLEHLTFDAEARIVSMRAFWNAEDIAPATD
jgi:steroid Delta-isomerase